MGWRLWLSDKTVRKFTELCEIYVFVGMLDSSWVTDTVEERGRYGLITYTAPERRLIYSTAITLAGVVTTVDMTRTFLSVVLLMVMCIVQWFSICFVCMLK